MESGAQGDEIQIFQLSHPESKTLSASMHLYASRTVPFPSVLELWQDQTAEYVVSTIGSL